MPRLVSTLADNMLTMDEPDHTRLRGIVDEAFRRRAVLDMEPRILAIADRLADGLFADGSPADLVERYARRLPLSVICELLGLPRSRPAEVHRLDKQFHPSHRCIDFLRFDSGRRVDGRYLERRLEAARAHGGEGLIAELVRVEKEGDRISAREMVAMVFLLLGAGTETTTHLISGSVYRAVAGIPSCATGSPRIGAAPTWRSRNSCASCRRYSSPSRVLRETTSIWAAFG